MCLYVKHCLYNLPYVHTCNELGLTRLSCVSSQLPDLSGLDHRSLFVTHSRCPLQVSCSSPSHHFTLDQADGVAQIWNIAWFKAERKNEHCRPYNWSKNFCPCISSSHMSLVKAGHAQAWCRHGVSVNAAMFLNYNTNAVFHGGSIGVRWMHYGFQIVIVPPGTGPSIPRHFLQVVEKTVIDKNKPLLVALTLLFHVLPHLSISLSYFHSFY